MLQIGSTTQRRTPTCAGVGDGVQPCRWRSAHARGVQIQLGHDAVHAHDHADPDSDDILDLEPTKDGLGYLASITRRRKDGSVMWTALPPGSVPQDV
jgi:hypothetical protein